MDYIGEIKQLYAFDRWANARMLEASVQLTPEQYAREIRSSFPSVRDTLAHIISSEWVWLSRWQGTSPRARDERFSTESLDELKKLWLEIEGEVKAFLDTVTEDRLDVPISYNTLAGEPQSEPLWQQLRHLINHSTYHRGQLTTMFRQLDAAPPNTDLISFYRVQKAM